MHNMGSRSFLKPNVKRGPKLSDLGFPGIPWDRASWAKACVCVFMFVRVCVCALCVVLVCMWMRLMDCQCVDSAAFVLVYVAYIVLYALRVFPAVTRLTVYRRLRVRGLGGANLKFNEK